MRYEELKDEIATISEIANSAPEPFRERCFEILLKHLLDSLSGKPQRSRTTLDEEEEAPPNGDFRPDTELPKPSQIKVFMQKTGVTADELSAIVMYEDDDIHFIREPTTNKVARGQIEWALLLALKSGILNNTLAVDPEAVRSIVQEKGFYDATNFIKNFKTAKNASFFQGQLDSQGEPQRLSSEGQKELGRLIKQLSGES